MDFYIPCDKLLALCCRWQIRERSQLGKGGLLLVVRCKLGCGLPGGSAEVSEEGRSGKLWVELVHERRDGEPPDQAAV